MAKKYHSGFKSDNGTEYDVEIFDSTFAGTSTAFVVDGRGFELSDEGEGDNPHGPIKTTRLSFSILTQTANESAISAFITALATAPEKQFQVKVLKGGSIFWFGNVLTDVSRQEDTSPYSFEVVAACGIGALSKIDYNNNGTAYSGTETLLAHAVKCLTKIGTMATFFTTGTAITTVVNWYEDSHVTGLTSDPFNLTRVDHRTFFDVDEQGKYTYKSALDVLKEVVQRMGAGIRLSNGTFRIEQIGERDNVSISERYYQKDGTYISAASVNHNITLNQTAEARLGSGGFEWLSALRQVEITYKGKDWTNRLAGAFWSSVSSPVFTVSGLVHTGGATTIRLVLGIAQSFQNVAYTAGVNVAVVYKVQIKIGSYYLRRNLADILNYGVTYTETTWSTLVSYYHFHREITSSTIPGVGTTHPVDTVLLDITPAPLPESGDMEVALYFHDLRQLNSGATVSIPGTMVITWEVQSPLLQVAASGNPVVDFADVVHISTADAGTANSEKMTFETITGDGQTTNSLSRLQVYNGTVWTDSSQWRVGASGSWLNIGYLHGAEIMAIRKTPVRTYEGSIRGSGVNHSRLAFDGSYWVMLSGTFLANIDEWRGKWLAIALARVGITPATPVPIDPVIVRPPNVPPTVPVPPGMAQIPGIISSATSAVVISTGTVTTITTDQTLNSGAFVIGQVITVVNPSTGFRQQFTVSANTPAGATSISVTGTATQDSPPGSFILVSPQNYTVQSYGTPPQATLSVKGGIINGSDIVARVINFAPMGFTVSAGNIANALMIIESGKILMYTTEYTVNVGANTATLTFDPVLFGVYRIIYF